MGQYFENDNNIKSNISEIKYTYYGKEITYKVDNGVFSKSRVDFGSNVLLQSLPKFENEKILDVGSGYGTIGLAIAKVFTKTNVLMCDVNLRAINLVNENITLNKITNAQVIESNTYENINELYDIIISNPPIRAGKEVVYDICLNAVNHLNEKGKVYFVVQKKQGADTLIKKMKEVYKEVIIIEKKNGYNVIQGNK